MRSGQPIDYLLLRQRKRLARDVIHEGGNVTDYAKEAGISLPAASRYLSKRAPCLLAALKDNSRYAAHSPHKVLRRLRVIASTPKRKDAAKALGLSVYGLYRFIRVYAPDGIEEALTEYEETYGAPLFEVAA